MRGTRPSLAGPGVELNASGWHRSSGGFAVRAAPVLAAGLALAILAVFQADRASAAETAFLAFWVTAALLPAAALAPSPGWEAVLGAPLAVLAVWALPSGPPRLAVVGVLLVTMAAVAAGRASIRALREAGDDRGTAAEGGFVAEVPAPGWRPADFARGVGAPGLPVILPLAIAAQVLLRSELLLAPDARAVGLLIVAPTLAALVVGRLAVLAGFPAALIAGAAVAALGPGFTVGTTLALLGVAAGAEIAASIAGRSRSWPALAVSATGLAVGLGLETRATVAALLAGYVLVLAALGRRDARALARKNEARSRAPVRRGRLRKRLADRHWPVMRSVATAIALPFVGAGLALRSLPEALDLLSWLPLVLPALILLALPARATLAGRWAPGLAAAALGWACAFAVPGPAAPAAALAVVALLAVAPPGAAAVGETAAAVPGGVAPHVRRPVLAAQAVWSAVLLAAVAVLASPPWLRSTPAADALALVGLEPGWLAATAVVAAVLISAAIGRSETSRLLDRPAGWAGRALAVVILGVLLVALPAPGRPVFEGPAAVLGPERPRLAVEVPQAPVGTVAIYTHLSNGLELAVDTEVATLALLDGEGRAVASRSLRAGLDTGEWAVRRPDVAALPGIEAPPPWAVWIGAGGGSEGPHERPFFGQYYRALLELEQPLVVAPGGGASPGAAADPRTAGGEDEDGTAGPAPDDGAPSAAPVATPAADGAARVVVERSSDLPADVLITVHRIEVAP